MALAHESKLHLELAAKPEGVGVVRQAIAGLAEAAQLDPDITADLKVAVSEACTNVVVHAYDHDAGHLEVDVKAADDDLIVVVRDRGSGFPDLKQSPTTEPPVGLGLPLIAALADSFELRENTGGAGMEVQMVFACKRSNQAS